MGFGSQLAVGIAANLPTGANPRGCWTFSHSPVGENSSHYVGEGPGSPSLRRGAGHPGSGHRRHPCPRSWHWIRHPDQAGVRDRDGAVTSGSEPSSRNAFEGGGMRYLRFKRWLTEIKQSGDGIDAVFFEEVRRHAGVDAALRLRRVHGSPLTAWCEHHQIPYQGVPGTIKQHATGKGNANKDR